MDFKNDALEEAERTAAIHSLRLMTPKLIELCDRHESYIAEIEKGDATDLSGVEREWLILNEMRQFVDISATDLLLGLGDRRQEDVEMHQLIAKRRGAIYSWFMARVGKWVAMGYYPLNDSQTYGA